jgi:hypothetical protein
VAEVVVAEAEAVVAVVAEAEAVVAEAVVAEAGVVVAAEAEAEVVVAAAEVAAVAPTFHGSETPDRVPADRCCTSLRAVPRPCTKAAGSLHPCSARRRPGWR